MDWNGKNVQAAVLATDQRDVVIRMPALVASQLAVLIERAERDPNAIASAPKGWAGVTEVKQALDFLLIERERAVPETRPAPEGIWPPAAIASMLAETKPSMSATEALRAFHPRIDGTEA